MASEVLNINIPKKLLPLTQAKRFKVAVGGRGGAKSETFAALHAGMVYQSGCRDVCCREFQKNIGQSVHSLMKRKIEELGLDGFESTDTEIRHKNGGQIIYQGLARDPEAIKSVDNAELCWVEEAQSLSHDSIEQLTPSIRGKDSEIWLSANLRNSKDPFSRRFIKPFEKELRKQGYYVDDMHTVIWVNYTDNPWFPPELEQERAHDEVALTEAEYAHKWLGEFNDTVENAIIPPAWFDACIDAHERLKIKPAGIEVVAHDPSDTGFDNKGLAYRHGILIKDAQEEAHGDINEGGDWAADYAHAVKPDVFTWDCDGLGIGLKRQFDEAFAGKTTRLEQFRGSNAVDRPDERYEHDSGAPGNSKTNKETFRNKRAQYYWNLRDRCRNTFEAVVNGKYIDPTKIISFSSKIEALDLLRSEICTVPLKHNGVGLIQIASKVEMAALNIDSPNMADSVMMTLPDNHIQPPRRPKMRVKRI